MDAPEVEVVPFLNYMKQTGKAILTMKALGADKFGNCEVEAID